MSWIDTWVLKEGMYWYNDQALWMYAGTLYNPKYQPHIPDWLSRLYDIARNGDVIAINRAITVLANVDAENPEFKRILQVWAFANAPEDVNDVINRTLDDRNQFQFVRGSANSIWWRLNGHTTERKLGAFVESILNKPKKKPKSKKGKSNKNATLEFKNEQSTYLESLPETRTPKKFKPQIKLPSNTGDSVERTTGKKLPVMPNVTKQFEKK